VQGGAPGPTAEGLKAATPAPTAPAAPAAPAPPAAQQPVRVGGNLKVPRKLKDVKPMYPAEAMAAGKQGIVIIEATIGADGKVTDAKVLRSIPELDDAAVGAVKQWEFEPALLNGVPTPIIMSVTVNFTLKGSEVPGVSASTIVFPPQSGAAGPGAQGLRAATPVPTAAAPLTGLTTAPVRVGGNIQAPRKIKDVKPVYPADAKAAGIQGIIILEVIIAPDGRVLDARPLRSMPELDAAAVEAVKQWEFTPTLLNGQPVPVIMSVTVSFSLF
jgi:protein TonB